METLKEMQLNVLNETIAIYNIKNRSVENSGCKYYLNSNTGCAIGRLIEDKELCKKLDGLDDDSSVRTVFNFFPKKIRELNINFLEQLQNLHDNTNNWDDNGISKIGKQEVEDIKVKFGL